jgi:hypothetical protein
MPPKTPIEALLSRLQKGDKDYSDVDQDTIEVVADYEGSGKKGGRFGHPKDLTVLRALAIKKAEESGNLRQPYLPDNTLGSMMLHENAVNNYKSEENAQKNLHGGNVDRLFKVLQLQDILRKK